MNATWDTAEHLRLRQDQRREQNWKRWGPYLSERQWGTVREDYSATGQAWEYFPHAQAPSRAYRWGEDGLLGLCDRQCRLCFAIALWNGRDAILKERLFGLTGPEGNHGEDVKEYYFYADATPTHSYARGLYKYPQAAFPYAQLLEENRRRGKLDREYELIDTGVFRESRYFDVTVEYCKAFPADVLIQITLHNRGPEAAELWVLPTFWFRNTWIWGCRHEGCSLKPSMRAAGPRSVLAEHETLGTMRAHFGAHPDGGAVELLFTENETNAPLLYQAPQYTPYVKDAFHRWLIHGERQAVHPDQRGTKAAAAYHLHIPAGGQRTLEARLHDSTAAWREAGGAEFDRCFAQRKQEADAFYAAVIPAEADPQQRSVMRQAYAGLLWSRQFYHFIVQDWLDGDLDVAEPPPQRKQGRNHRWRHLYARDVISMPDKWEYPWFAAWDLAFHVIPLAEVDPEFAKQQLLLLLREWYMHPNGQLPAYEFAFYDVNPPVHAWACLRVYQLTKAQGHADRAFLATAFQRLLMNFTWWVNQVDANGDNVFAGGFLGLDNIGIFDRSRETPAWASLEQADGTAWMAFYCGSMLSIALELARDDAAYADMASKFLDHFVRIIDAIHSPHGGGLWDSEDGFYYDHLRTSDALLPLKVRSLVGLLPLIAVEILDQELVDRLPSFRRRLDWFLKYRHDLAPNVSLAQCSATGSRMLLAIPSRQRLERILSRLLDEREFLSPFGIRSLSRVHLEHPFELQSDGTVQRVAYVPGESDSHMFGGNSNWRGPIWLPVNFLLIEALEKYYEFYGDDLQVACPFGSASRMNLRQISRELNQRLAGLFLRTAPGSNQRTCLGKLSQLCTDDCERELQLYYEYFNGDTGEGLGASHQTGWTALIACCLKKLLVPRTD